MLLMFLRSSQLSQPAEPGRRLGVCLSWPSGEDLDAEAGGSLGGLLVLSRMEQGRVGVLMLPSSYHDHDLLHVAVFSSLTSGVAELRYLARQRAIQYAESFVVQKTVAYLFCYAATPATLLQYDLH